MSEGPEVTPEHPDEVIQTIRTIGATMETIGKSLGSIEAFGKRTRQITIALIFSLLLDVALTGVVGILSYNAFASTNTVRAVQYSECISANQMRQDQIRLWDFFVGLAQTQPAHPGETQAEKDASAKAIVNLEHFVDQTFATKPCNL